MLRLISILVMSASLLTMPIATGNLFAEKKSENVQKENLTQSQKDSQRKKDILIADINALRNQEARVAVLQQLLNEEGVRLRQLQALFCDQHKLNLSKFRSGEYVYDAQKESFIERSKIVETDRDE